ncbi:AUGMIN subunit 8 [Silene latifolia]|uniref:AUGMIN subunit 8 n=1 Tax=Silene latifolia TaxID=37657 RepID=UPI003D7718B4
MDVFEVLQELHKESTTKTIPTVDTLRRPLIPAERNNHGISAARRSSTPTSRWSPSPRGVNKSAATTTTTTTQLGSSKRAFSAERKRPSTPPSPAASVTPATPVGDTAVGSVVSVSKKNNGSKLPEVLWPSTMRSLSVSFQSDNISIPVVKKEKAVISDRTLKPSLNVGSGTRNPTPERKRSPLKGKNSTTSRLSENSKPVDGVGGGVQTRLIDQHRWPSRNAGKLSTSILTKSVDLSHNNNNNGVSTLRRLSLDGIPRNLVKVPNDAEIPRTGIGYSSLRRLSLDGIPRNLQKTSSDASQQSEFEDHITALGLRVKLDDSEKGVRSRCVSGSRLPSPSKTKGTPSPSKTRPSTPVRGTSPSRIRPSSPTRQPSSSPASVLSFVADIKKGKKINQLEDAHQLRLLYNRQLQWRFANARADSALYIQRLDTEQILYNVSETNLELWDSVLRKRIELQRVNLDLKLNLVLREQMAYLEDWDLLEKDHSSSLNGAIEDLEASTLRLPVTGGAKADIDSLKVVVSSAADVMQTMGSSIGSLLSKAEEMNGLVSELAELAGHERALINQCDTLLSSSAAMKVKEYSLRTQLIQSQQDLPKTNFPLF